MVSSIWESHLNPEKLEVLRNKTGEILVLCIFLFLILKVKIVEDLSIMEISLQWHWATRFSFSNKNTNKLILRVPKSFLTLRNSKWISKRSEWCPGWVGSVGWSVVPSSKGCRSDPVTVHMGLCGGQEATNWGLPFTLMFLSCSLPTLSLKSIYKISLGKD